MKYIFFLIVALMVLLSSCETRQTIYFNNKWEVVDDSTNATYYRDALIKSDRVEFVDYYSTGEKHSDGTFLGVNPFCESCQTCGCDGDFNYYYKDGWRYLTQSFKDGKFVGDDKNGCDYECGAQQHGDENTLVYCCKRSTEKGIGAPLHDPWILDIDIVPDAQLDSIGALNPNDTLQ